MPSFPAPIGDAPGKPTAGLLPAVLVSIFVFTATAVSAYAPPPEGEMAVVFPAGTNEQSSYYAILQAGGRFVGPTRLSNIVVAYGADTGFADRVRAAGALFLLAAHGLCAPQIPPGAS